MKHTTSAAIQIFLVFTSTSAVAAVTTSNYLDIDGGVVTTFSGPITGGPQTVNVGPVTVTTTRADSVSGIFSFAQNDPDNPAGSTSFGATVVLPMILNLSQPVAAFGITFNHIYALDPALLEVYEGQDGLGTLVGSITSVPNPPPWSESNIPVDFVAVWSDLPNIQSAVIQGLGSTRVNVAAIAISLTPVPEPASVLLISVCVASTVLCIRRQRKRGA